MVSLTPFIFSSPSFSCSISSSKRSAHSRTKFRLSSHITGRSSYATYRAENASREQLLDPLDHSLIEPTQIYNQEPRRLTLGSWYFLKHSKITRTVETDSSSQEFEDYYLLEATSRPVLSTEIQPRDSKKNSARMASNFRPDANGNTNSIFGESFETTTATLRNERRRSYGIGGAGNIRKPSEVIYTPRERRRSSVFSNPSVSVYLILLVQRGEASCHGLELEVSKGKRNSG
ncbi:hypothetical protein EYC80_007752 [Monilinia laxa]|uniref:Uncharacterized protein n=1 Tax=Monilinia laxa TaxID=61186 RepID=A0A5N6JWW7_MONLA|nr:hypothetical protein EYC80_007752 [Monilinia laxa]